ncbi:MAG TPA: hypothetical protein VL422_18645 [Miltoncostaea sp.]|jgi:hypothetical protein|nr:hypothetical protein [Miltoncostaea sp.]
MIEADRPGAEEPPLYLDRAQVRRFMGLGDTEVERAFRALPVYRLSMRKVRVRRDELIEWIERHRLDPPVPKPRDDGGR